MLTRFKQLLQIEKVLNWFRKPRPETVEINIDELASVVGDFLAEQVEVPGIDEVSERNGAKAVLKFGMGFLANAGRNVPGITVK